MKIPLLIVTILSTASCAQRLSTKLASLSLKPGEISAEELTKVEDAEITGLVKKEENVGLHVVTDGESRRSFWQTSSGV